MPEYLIDLSRPPTAVERAQLERRLQRLEATGYSDHLASIQELLMAHHRPHSRFAEGLRLRHPYAYLEDPIPGDYSDRKAPPRELRPPATRISSSRGAALRFHLSTISLVQLARKPGTKARVVDLELPIVGDAGTSAWSDLIPSTPPATNSDGVYYTSRVKRARSVRQSLDALADAGLVDVPGAPRERQRYDSFVLLNESRAEPAEYTVPAMNHATFSLPAMFVLEGWLHVLEDSEIAVLLMLACRRGGWLEDGRLAMPAETRLLHYGIHRDRLRAATKTLEWFGLIDVARINRHESGKAVEGSQFTNRFALNREAFDEPAVPTAIKAIKAQLQR